MGITAELKFYCDGNTHLCDEAKPHNYGGYCAHNQGVPFTNERVCVNKEVQKRILMEILSYSPGPNNG